jgi:1,4-alpha-glucan branching enzyme
MPEGDIIDTPIVDRAAADAIRCGAHGDPFAVLGPHETPHGRVIRAFLPGAKAVEVRARDDRHRLCTMREMGGLFVGRPAGAEPYYFRITWPDSVEETEDPYSFGFVLGSLDLHLFTEGSHWRLAERFGAVPEIREGVSGVAFAVWAPNAQRVSVVGDFNAWDGRRHPMRLRPEAGMWELFIPRLRPGERYKFEILDRDGNRLPLKADPIARATERPPATASVVAELPAFRWTDGEWLRTRAAKQARTAPVSIYEVHAASWMRPGKDPSSVFDWHALADRLIPYVAKLGFTHIELMPIMEHPFAGSWGYQPLSQFAPSARFGRPEDFARFVDRCHAANLGVILDWVPAHFPTDAHGLARFDGTALYEHADPREGFHPDWNTYVYNLGRREVSGFLIASALFWLQTFHVDALRVDAVASMLYRDYSRREGEWVPNHYGGRENLESIHFLKRLNDLVAAHCPGAITIAEESTAWPGVSAPTLEGGLGFSYKWNMGWMHDTLAYVGRDPIHRKWGHHDFTFGLLYAFSERFILPLSHDEVVHGKGSLYGRIPGDKWQKLATLRAYFAFMWTHPGKKLLFMGGELGQPREWNHDAELEWSLLDDPLHAGLQRLVGDLNRLCRAEAALHQADADPHGFQWLIGDDSANSVFAYLRRAPGATPIVAILNMTPVPRHGYRVGVPEIGQWCEILNTDAGLYGGSNVGNLGGVEARPEKLHGQNHSIALSLPPLGGLILKPGG